MIEAILRDYLILTTQKTVYLEIPANAADEYYAIERVGGSEEEKLFKSSITIESHGSSLYRSALMDEELIAAMENAIECTDISSVALNSHYNATDPERKIYKYKALFDITHY